LQFEKSRSSIKIQGIFVILLSFFVIRNFRVTRLFIEMLAEYMFRERLGAPVLSIRCPETSAIFIQYRFQPESKFKQMNLVPVAFDTPARHYSWSTDCWRHLRLRLCQMVGAMRNKGRLLVVSQQKPFCIHFFISLSR